MFVKKSIGYKSAQRAGEGQKGRTKRKDKKGQVGFPGWRFVATKLRRIFHATNSSFILRKS